MYYISEFSALASLSSLRYLSLEEDNILDLSAFTNVQQITLEDLYIYQETYDINRDVARELKDHGCKIHIIENYDLGD